MSSTDQGGAKRRSDISSLWFVCCLFPPSCGHNWGEASLLRGIYGEHSYNNLVRFGVQILAAQGQLFLSHLKIVC